MMDIGPANECFSTFTQRRHTISHVLWHEYINEPVRPGMYGTINLVAFRLRTMSQSFFRGLRVFIFCPFR